MQSSYFMEFDVFSDSSDTSCGIYSTAAFMTVYMHCILRLYYLKAATIKTVAINW